MTEQRPLRILYGITKSNFGGAQRYVFDLALAAKAEGHHVRVVCGGKGVLVEKLLGENIEVTVLPHLGRDISTFDDVRSYFFLMGVLHDFKPDVFHINSSKMGGIGGLAGRVMRVPKIIFTAHGWAFNEPRPKFQQEVIKFFHWVTLLLAHKVICVSEKTYHNVSNWAFIKKRLRIIKNGIDAFPLLTRIEARKILAPDSAPSSLLVGTLSELHIVKGLDTLISAWSVLRKEDRLIIFGEGSERKELQNLVQIFGLEGRVIFKGFVDDARSLLSGLDMFVMPSRSEAMPYALLEAGLASLATVATKVGGIPEIINNEENGLLISPDDHEMLASCLLLLASDQGMRKEFGKNLKKTIEEKFSMEKMIGHTFYLYT